MSSTASAPIARASHTSRALTVKSFRSTGREQAVRAARRSSGSPPKNWWSVSTDRQAAPPASYSTATVAGSRSGSRSPFDGDRRLISEITAMPYRVLAAAIASANERVAPPRSACSPAASTSPVLAAGLRSHFPNHDSRHCRPGGRLDLMVPAEETLVVIEDDHHISDLVAMYLRRDGFRVLQAEDGETGLALVEREHPKLVIVDIGLPGALDGLDVCRRLRSSTAPAGGDRRGGEERAAR